MSFRVILTERAKSDLAEIYHYIAVVLCSPGNAAGQLSRLENAILSLDEMPERYRVYDKPQWRDRNLRIMSVDNYVVLYIPTREENTVNILRIMYGGRDVDRELALPQ